MSGRSLSTLDDDGLPEELDKVVETTKDVWSGLLAVLDRITIVNKTKKRVTGMMRLDRLAMADVVDDDHSLTVESLEVPPLPTTRRRPSPANIDTMDVELSQ